MSHGLAGRSMDLSTDLLEKFRQFSLETGILPENIAFLPKNGTFLSFKWDVLLKIKGDVKY